MDRTERYRTIIKDLLQEIAGYTPSTEEVRTELIFDDERGHYQLCFVGWEEDRRIHNIVMHFDLIDGKIWIQENATDIEIDRDFLRAGVPLDHMVAGLLPPKMRQYSDFAVA